MSVRLPSAASYASQVEKEQKWLPILAKKLSLPIPVPIAKGNPNVERVSPSCYSGRKGLNGD